MLIQLNNVHINVHKQTILRDISTCIADNKLNFIIGPNGSGKSTLLKTLAGLIPIKQGTYRLHGQSIEHYSKKNLARHIAYLPQHAVIPDNISVYDLVALGRFSHHPWWQNHSKHDKPIIQSALMQVNMLDYQQRKLDTLSGGQLQRARLAMLLAQDTPILLLDEPTNGLDLAQQIRFYRCLLRLQQQGKTIIMVAHDLIQTLHYSNHVFIMCAGKLITYGHTKRILSQAIVRDVFAVDDNYSDKVFGHFAEVC